MDTFPDRVDLDDDQIAELRDEYKKADDDLTVILLSIAAGALSVVMVNQAKQRVQQRISQLNGTISQWADKNVGQAYEQGKLDAIKQLQSFNDALADQIAQKISSGDFTIDQLHREAQQALSADMKARLSESITQMGRSADKTLSQMLHKGLSQKIANAGEDVSLRELKKSLLDVFDKNGVNALVDRAGKRWSPDVYAEMLSRTTLSQARNTGLTNSLASQGYDLVLVSSHGAKDDCGPWEGATLSLNGNVPGFMTVADAAAGGLFHVNCQHSLNTLDPDKYPSDYLPPIDE